MGATAVRKIVFGGAEDARPVNLTTSTSIQESNSAGLVTRETRESLENSNNVVSTVSSLQTRIIPPSKLAALGLLPSNMLVTSVEFGRQGKKKNRREDRGIYAKFSSLTGMGIGHLRVPTMATYTGHMEMDKGCC
jgi:hypothetical protein